MKNNVENLNGVQRFALQMLNCGALSLVDSGLAMVYSDKKEVANSIAILIDKWIGFFKNVDNFESDVLIGDTIEKKAEKDGVKFEYFTPLIFSDIGISNYLFNSEHLISLGEGVEGVDFKLLQNSNFAIEFDYFEYAFTEGFNGNIYHVWDRAIFHQKGDPAYKTTLLDGVHRRWPLTSEYAVSPNVLAEAKLHLDTAKSVFPDFEERTCFARLLVNILQLSEEFNFFPIEEAGENLKRNKKEILKLFNVSSYKEIIEDAKEYFEEDDPIFFKVKSILENADN